MLLAGASFGFKVPTHLASANETLDILGIEIDPLSPAGDVMSFVVDGELFQIPVSSKSAYAAIFENPEYFRAGAIGPDGFSDLISGQLFQHGNESGLAMDMVEGATGGQITPESFLMSNPPAPLQVRTRPSQYRSIDFAMLMLSEWQALRTSTAFFLTAQEERQALAFILGYIAHCVGDAFAHHWVNQIVGHAWDFSIGQGLFRTYTEEFQHHILEEWVDAQVPGELENDDGSEDGQFDRYGIRAPARFLTQFFATRNLLQPEFGDRNSSEPGEFLKYYSNTDQFHGGPTYNYFNVQRDIGKAAENWAFIRDVVEATEGAPQLPQSWQDFLHMLDVPADVVNDVVDWAQGDLTEFFTGMNCDFVETPEGFQLILGVWNFLATFDTRVDAYTAKAEVARANWVKLSECTMQNIARKEGPDFDPASPASNRDACTVLADSAAAGIWEDNAPDRNGLVRGSVTDQAWLGETIQHFRGVYTPGVAVLADAIGQVVEEEYGDARPELANLRHLLFTATQSGPYEPDSRHRSTLQNVLRQEEYLWGPGFLMDDFRDTLVASEFGPIFQDLCNRARDPDVRQCMNAELRAAMTAYESLGVGKCAQEYSNCRTDGLFECARGLCEDACNASTFGFAGGACENACSTASAAICKEILDPLCPQVCLVSGCDALGSGCVPTGVGCAGIPGGTDCCAGGIGVSLPCGLDRDAICTFDRTEAECDGFFSTDCDEELLLECTPDRIQGIVENAFFLTDYENEILQPFVEFCDAVEEPLETFARYVVDNKEDLYDFLNANRPVLAFAGGAISFWLSITDTWEATTPDGRVNAAFANDDVAVDPAYRALLRQRAVSARNANLANPLVVEGLTEFIAALDSGTNMVLDINDTDPGAGWAQAIDFATENARQINKMRAVLETGVFEGIDGPILARIKADMGVDLRESFDPFFNTVHGMKLIPLNSQANIRAIFNEPDPAVLPILPWEPSSKSSYSGSCAEPALTNIYCDVLASNDDPACMNCSSMPQVDELGWTIGRGLIAFNDYDPSGATPDHVTTFFPLATSDDAYERIYRRIFRTPVFLMEWLGFEGPEGLDAWSVDQGQATLGLDGDLRSQGAYSLEVAGCNYIGISSRRFDTTELGILSHRLALDVYVPPAPASQSVGWFGSIDVNASIPAASVYNAYLGHAELTPLTKGTFSTVTFPVSQAVYDALSGDLPGAQLHLKLNTPCVAGMDNYRLDNIRFVEDVERRTQFHTTASRALDVRTNSLFSFENAAQWSALSAGTTLSAEATLREHGNASLRVSGSGWTPVRSVSFNTAAVIGATAGPWLNVDVYVPGPQSQYDWLGDFSVVVDCPGTPVGNVSLGPAQLTQRFENEFNSILLAVPQWVEDVLGGDHQCTITPTLNLASSTTGDFLLDKMGFVDEP